jgi:hypothetical protein
MDPRTLIATRIDLKLRRLLGQGVDATRAISDTRYARDMLLVCDAMAGTDLPQLASDFRAAGEQVAAARRGGASPGPRSFAAVAQRSFAFPRAR